MEVVTQHYERPAHAVDAIHALFKEWQQRESEAAEGSVAIAAATMLEQAELAAHEWLANLAQHADFQGRTPDIRLRIEREPERMRCFIDDNSAGFDMEAELDDRRDAIAMLPERGMGLQIIDSCTQRFSYTRTGPHGHRLELHLAAPDTQG